MVYLPLIDDRSDLIRHEHDDNIGLLRLPADTGSKPSATPVVVGAAGRLATITDNPLSPDSAHGHASCRSNYRYRLFLKQVDVSILVVIHLGHLVHRPLEVMSTLGANVLLRPVSDTFARFAPRTMAILPVRAISLMP